MNCDCVSNYQLAAQVKSTETPFTEVMFKVLIPAVYHQIIADAEQTVCQMSDLCAKHSTLLISIIHHP